MLSRTGGLRHRIVSRPVYAPNGHKCGFVLLFSEKGIG